MKIPHSVHTPLRGRFFNKNAYKQNVAASFNPF